MFNHRSNNIGREGSDMIRRNLPDAPAWAFPVLAIFGVINIMCLIALFKWKKWGFYGALASGILVCVINVSIGLNIVQAVLGLAGIAILYGVLQIGGDKKGWAQLE